MGIDLGNCLMTAFTYAIKTKEHYSSRRGALTRDRNDAYQSDPIFKLECDQYATPILPLIYLGTAAADVTQAAITAPTGTFTTTAIVGGTVYVGKKKINTVVMTAPAAKTVDVDYVIDAGRGMLHIPLASTIAAAATVTITFGCAAITTNQITAMTELNKAGSFIIDEEDEFDTDPKTRHTFTGILTADSPGDGKVEDYKKVTFQITPTSAILVSKRN